MCPTSMKIGPVMQNFIPPLTYFMKKWARRHQKLRILGSRLETVTGGVTFFDFGMPYLRFYVCDLSVCEY